LLKHAVELGKPVLLLNVGPSRGDSIEEVERIDMASGLIILDVVKTVLYVPLDPCCVQVNSHLISEGRPRRRIL
jgi:hypothetical protein